MLRLLSLALLGASARAEPLRMKPLGAYCDSDCEETTPVLWPPGSGQLVLVGERHRDFRVRRQRYNGVGNNTVLLEHVPKSTSFGYASAMVVEATGTLWVFATNELPVAGPGGATMARHKVLQAWWSSDPALAPHTWRTAPLIVRNESWWEAFNTAPTFGVLEGRPAYVLAIEQGARCTIQPQRLCPANFTTIFAACTECAETGDLSSGWRVLDTATHSYLRARDTSCPAIRFFGGWFYLVSSLANVTDPRGPHCNSASTKWSGCLLNHISRSRDLKTWEESPHPGGGVIMGFPDGRDLHGPDHTVLAGSLLDEEIRAAGGLPDAWKLAVNETDDVNRSDPDFVTLPDGTTYVVWLTGNQGLFTPPNVETGAAAAGIVNATEREWLESYF